MLTYHSPYLLSTCLYSWALCIAARRFAIGKICCILLPWVKAITLLRMVLEHLTTYVPIFLPTLSPYKCTHRRPCPLTIQVPRATHRNCGRRNYSTLFTKQKVGNLRISIFLAIIIRHPIHIRLLWPVLGICTIRQAMSTRICLAQSCSCPGQSRHTRIYCRDFQLRASTTSLPSPFFCLCSVLLWVECIVPCFYEPFRRREPNMAAIRSVWCLRFDRCNGLLWHLLWILLRAFLVDDLLYRSLCISADITVLLIRMLQIVFITIACGLFCSIPRFRHPQWRVILFVSICFYGCLPMTHLAEQWGRPKTNESWNLMFLEGLSYGVGAAVGEHFDARNPTDAFQFRIPERWRPGSFDILGASHQIFHFYAILGASLHYKVFFRDSTTIIVRNRNSAKSTY